MRRRPSAAADDVTNAIPTDENIVPPSPVEGTEKPKPVRARRTAKKAVTDETPVETAPEETPVVEAVVEEKPKPTRTRRTPAKKAESPQPPSDGGESEALGGQPVEETPAPVVEAVVEEKPKPARTRRTPAKKAEPIAEAPVVEETPAPVVVEEAPAPPSDGGEAEGGTTDALGGQAEGAPRRSRNRRGRGGKRGDAPAEAGTSADASPITGGQGAENSQGATESAEDAGNPRRVRGLRRTRTVAAPGLMMSGEAAPVEEEVDPEAEKLKARRTRGQRKERPATVVVTVAEQAIAVVPATPVEPLPPAYQPLPAEVLANLAETKIVPSGGVNELHVNGEARLPLWFFVNTEMDPDAKPIAQRQIRLAYEAGVRTFTVLAHLPWKTRTGERRFDLLDGVLNFVHENAPEALILPRLIFSPPGSFVRAYPNEMVRYQSGEDGDVSMASRAFWEGEADEALRAAVEHVAQGPHAGRVFGFYLEHGEWLYEKGLGFDFSDANQQGFRSWLRAKYRNSLVGLRAAWHDGSVTFDSAQVPAWPAPSGATLLFTEREGRYVDFHEYSSDIVAQTILRLGKAVKEASGGRSAVAVSYGYTLELPRAYSGHLSLGQVLASPYVDILTGPISYSGREPGGSAPAPAPLDSIALAGKLWISEDDTKTPKASGETPDGYNPRLTDAEGVRAAHARNFGAALAKGVGLSWMDLWGEGWLDDRETWGFLGSLRAIAEKTAARRKARTKPAPAPEVAVILDERSFFAVREESLLDELISLQRDALLRCGARVGFYLLSDLQKKDFPLGAKLVLFLNAFSLDAPTKAAIQERLQGEGRTLAWVFGPCCREEILSECADVIGMQVKLQPWASKTGATVLPNATSPLVDVLRGQPIGIVRRLNPSFAVTDSRAQTLAEYPAGGVALAIRKHATWQSVFIGEPNLPLPLLRGLLRVAGIAPLTVDDDVAWVGDGLICLHSTEGGGTNVYLPSEGAIYDVLTGESLAGVGRGARYSMPLRGTRILAWGGEAELSALGADLRFAPTALTAGELPRAPAPFVFDSPSSLPPAEISAEDEALFAAALAEMPADPKSEDGEDDFDAPAPEAPIAAATVAAAPETAEAAEKRRRRRRGRGRGNRPEEGEGVAEGEAPAAVASEPTRTPPPLSELLPDSEAPLDPDALPIPEEFLDDAPAAEARPRRRRGRRGAGATSPEAPEAGPAPEAAPESEG